MNTTDNRPRERYSEIAVNAVRFVEVASMLGLEFIYVTGATGESLMTETMGGGCGSLDFDRDGNWDFFFCQGGDPQGATADQSQPKDTLFRQLNDHSFVDVTVNGLPQTDYRYGQGVAVGDFDADGFDDVFITNVEANQLFHNMGDGTFAEISNDVGIRSVNWSSSSAFADLNGDNLPDIYVANYVQYDPRHPIDCLNQKGEHRICHPHEIPDIPDEVYISNGDGTFEERSASYGLTGRGSKGLAVAIADFDNDNDPDIYVSNDTTANFLFLNDGGGKFNESALLMACGLDRTGAYQASMGLGIGDYDRNGLLDIYVSHFYDESNTLYRNLGAAGFQDVTAITGLHEPTLQSLGFGTVMEDFDADGNVEIFVTNGHVENYPDNYLHKMKPQLFTFRQGRFLDIAKSSGDIFDHKSVGRGVCSGDFDDDGDIDLVVVRQDEQVAFLRNESAGQAWLNVLCHGRQSDRRGIGCRISVTINGQQFDQQLFSGGSYASSRQPMVSFGFGDLVGPADVTIRWPSGVLQKLEDVSLNQTLAVLEPKLE